MTRSEVSLQTQRLGLHAEKPDDIAHVLLERKAELLGPSLEIVAAHRFGEGLVLHSLQHRASLEIEDALRWPDERRGGDESRHLVAGIQRLLEARFTRHAGIIGVREDRARD